MASKATTKSSSQKPRAKKVQAVEVKNSKDVLSMFNRYVFKNLHDRYNARLSEPTRQKIVAYGPWLAIFTLLFIAPELLVLANNAMFISPTGFLEKVLFNRDSWVLLIIVFVNIISAVDGLSELFNKTKRGWNRIYFALLINIGYVLFQLFTHLEQPAAPLLALLGFTACLFALLDVREYYS